MIESLPPGLILIVGALLIPLLPKKLQPWLAVALPAAGLAQVLLLSPGASHQLRLFDLDLVLPGDIEAVEDLGRRIEKLTERLAAAEAERAAHGGPPPAGPLWLRAAPNPFNPRTTIAVGPLY